MIDLKPIENSFNQGLDVLGLDDDSLILVDCDTNLVSAQIKFHIERAKDFNATAIYVRRQLNGSYKSQVYIYDFTSLDFSDESEGELVEIQKRVWTSGEVPLVCIFFKTEIKILNCTKHITKNFKPEYLVDNLKLSGKAHSVYNKQFAVKIKSGIFWEQEELKNKFKFQNSSYDKLIDNIRFVIKKLSIEFIGIQKELLNKIIVQSILIKYLEERIDSNGNKLLSEKYFKKYDGADSFGQVLKIGRFAELLSDLNDEKRGFNGNIFKWSNEERNELKKLDLNIVADLLATDKSYLHSSQLELNFPDWRYFEFKYIPVELISRLYEEFLGEEKKDKGLYYTPSHLAGLLVDECLPLSKYSDINLDNFKLLDPACGSGIFLVVCFKRLVQIWRLQNEMQVPTLRVLKSILRNIYGIDKEEQAVRLASFSLSLALCNELNPVKIINELKFDDLREKNLINSDFFVSNILDNSKFDLVIGNPPFVRGAISNYSNNWETDDFKVKIPQGQIALKFLSESLFKLKDNGLVCLIIKSSGLLFNSSSINYKNALFSNFGVVQILDFTALARNKSLWDNGADVASAAIFINNKEPDLSKNILHLTFRRTRATKERIIFEIDDYDLHFVNRQTALNNPYIWKNNLLGGGRIANLVEKVQSIDNLKIALDERNCIIEEGFEIGSKKHLSPEFMYRVPFLPTSAITEDKIDYSQLNQLSKDEKFSKIPDERAFLAPNLIIWENTGTSRFPIFFNKKNFTFKRRLISIKSLDDNIKVLRDVFESFENFYSFYKFYFLATSGETLINRNNTFLLRDLKRLPYVSKEFTGFSRIDSNVINDSINFYEDFFIHGEKSFALHPIKKNEFVAFITKYGLEFSYALNIILEDGQNKFRLTDVVELKNSLIATVFKYDNLKSKLKFHQNFEDLDIDGLTSLDISSQLSINRIIKLYPQKDTIVFIKPNQYRYWLSSTAYRDADKGFSDISKSIN